MSGARVGVFLSKARLEAPIARTCCALALLCSCAAAGDDRASTDARAQSLIGGTVSDSANDAVVFLRGTHEDASFTDCTATLVAPHVALTAKHCVVQVHPGNFVCSGNGELIQDGTGAGVMGAPLSPERIEIHSGVLPHDEVAALASRVFVTASTDACHDDVAVVLLDRAVAAPFYPAIRWTEPTRTGELVRLMGYGMGERRGPLERHEISEVRVVDVNSETGPDDETATTPRRTFAIDGNTACFGDSGGPAFSSERGALVGVYSRITGDCFAAESRNTFMLASSYTALLDKALDASGESAAREPEPAPPVEPEPVTPASSAGSHGAFKCSLGAQSGSLGAAPWCALALWALTRRRRRAAS
jgi:hypothetical protein